MGGKTCAGRSFRRDAENHTPEAYAPGPEERHPVSTSAFRFRRPERDWLVFPAAGYPTGNRRKPCADGAKGAGQEPLAGQSANRQEPMETQRRRVAQRNAERQIPLCAPRRFLRLGVETKRGCGWGGAESGIAAALCHRSPTAFLTELLPRRAVPPRMVNDLGATARKGTEEGEVGLAVAGHEAASNSVKSEDPFTDHFVIPNQSAAKDRSHSSTQLSCSVQ